MNNEQDLLRQHAILDNRIRLIRADVQSARSAVSDQSTLLALKNDDLASLHSNKAQQGTLKKALDRDILRYVGQQNAAERIVESGSESAEKAILQITKCQDLIDAAETKMLLLLEEEEAINGRISTTIETIAATRVALREAKINAKQVIKTGKDQFTFESTQRRQVRSELADHLITRYDTLFTRRGTAVAYLKDNTCSSCNSVANGSCIAEINRGRLAACRRCGRWLVKEEE